MKKIIIVFIILLTGLEILGWGMYKISQKDNNKTPQPISSANQEISDNKKPADDTSVNQDISSDEQTLEGFPPIIVEKNGDITERTIHMGVRQWEWTPRQVKANFGEKVRLVMHNGDVLHSISIPELGVRKDIPEDGAVIEFMATKRGTFTFSCDTPCGKDHKKMVGKIIIS
jgi:heme/copper-type cytochrome/quinol oxidase subunit 2